MIFAKDYKHNGCAVYTKEIGTCVNGVAYTYRKRARERNNTSDRKTAAM